MPRPMTDLVVVVPGILGSELRKDGHLIWGFPEGVRGLLRARPWMRESAAHLELKEDHPTKPYLEDGVRATALVSLPQAIAGFIKTDGYDLLRERLFDAFQLEPANQITAGNYLEFPYDWRRDNRAAAHRLHAAVNQALDRWRDATGNPDAKAIYICHSMGGLVTRYHLEVLGGRQHCRALITLATPYRGAVNALDFLVRGYSTAGVDLTAVLRSCTSVYQLLPIYEMVDVGGKSCRVFECADLPSVSQARAREARAFHDEILQAVQARSHDAYPIFYFSGVAQPTLQSATLSGSVFQADRYVPDTFPTYRETGDGTVPYVSSIPPELSNDPRGAFVIPTCHAMIQSSEEAWGQVEMILNRLQDASIGQVLDATAKAAGAAPPAIALQLDDVYTGERVVLRARLLNARGSHRLEAELHLAGAPPKNDRFPLGVNGQSHEVQLPVMVGPGVIGPLPLVPEEGTSGEDRWVLSVDRLPEGTYRLKVQTVSRSGAPVPAEDVFEVARPPRPSGE